MYSSWLSLLAAAWQCLCCNLVFKRVNSTVSQVEQVPLPLPSHVPEHHETSLSTMRLNAEDYASVVLAVSDLSDPDVQSNKRRRRGKYSVFINEDRAKIGKYAKELDNGLAKNSPISMRTS